MSDKPKAQLLTIYLNEYTKLKDEQLKRINFRDNLLYVTLGVFGGLVSYALSDPTRYYALLVIPWICFILGWVYVANDQKITAIGRYIRLTLVKRICEHIGGEPKGIFGWETERRNVPKRRGRKIIQLIVNGATFFVSGIVAVVIFWFLMPDSHWSVWLLGIVEFILLIILEIQILLYADIEERQ